MCPSEGEGRHAAVCPKVTLSALVVVRARTRVTPDPFGPSEFWGPSEARVKVTKSVSSSPKPLRQFSQPFSMPGCLSGFAGRALCSLYFRREVDTSPLKLPHKSWKYIEQRIPFPVLGRQAHVPGFHSWPSTPGR